MDKMEILEAYIKYCEEKGYKRPMIPTVYSTEDILGDIFSNLEGQAFREGLKQGREEEY